MINSANFINDYELLTAFESGADEADKLRAVADLVVSAYLADQAHALTPTVNRVARALEKIANSIAMNDGEGAVRVTNV